MTEYDNITKLIEDVNKILLTEKAERYRKGKEFNVFAIQQTDTDEVRVCRLLRELLDPKGSHGQGDIFLRIFIEKVLGMDKKTFADSDYSSAKVMREELTDSSRRIDLVISIGSRYFPIEVKIYANDQDSQCFDYYEYAKRRDKDTILYYLTLDGHKPSEESIRELKDKQYQCISFFEDIHDWINDCIHNPQIEQIYSIREILIQFRSAIEGLNGIERGRVMEIKDRISSTEETFVAANIIANTLSAVKAEMMCRVFEELERYIKSKMQTECLEYYQSEAEEYYKKGKSSWPSINFLIPIKDENIDGKIVFRIEIDQKLYCGVCGWYGTNNWDGKKTEELSAYISEHLNPAHSKRKSSNWYWWEYIDNEVDFRYCNDSYTALFDPEKHEATLERIFRKLDEYLVPLA